MLTKENKQKITCLAGLCDHTETDSSCLFLKVVDKGPEYWANLIEKIVEDEIKARGLKTAAKGKKNVKRKAVRK